MTPDETQSEVPPVAIAKNWPFQKMNPLLAHTLQHNRHFSYFHVANMLHPLPYLFRAKDFRHRQVFLDSIQTVGSLVEWLWFAFIYFSLCDLKSVSQQNCETGLWSERFNLEKSLNLISPRISTNLSDISVQKKLTRKVKKCQYYNVVPRKFWVPGKLSFEA